MTFYRQCTLGNDGTLYGDGSWIGPSKMVAWIPAEFAQKGRVIQVEKGQRWWKVEKAGILSMPESFIRAAERANLAFVTRPKGSS